MRGSKRSRGRATRLPYVYTVTIYTGLEGNRPLHQKLRWPDTPFADDRSQLGKTMGFWSPEEASRYAKSKGLKRLRKRNGEATMWDAALRWFEDPDAPHCYEVVEGQLALDADRATIGRIVSSDVVQVNPRPKSRSRKRRIRRQPNMAHQPPFSPDDADFHGSPDVSGVES